MGGRKEKKKESKQRNRGIHLPKDAPTSRTYLPISVANRGIDLPKDAPTSRTYLLIPIPQQIHILSILGNRDEVAL